MTLQINILRGCAMSQQEKKAVVADGSEVPEETKKVSGEAQDPKNVGELTHYIQNMLQQMQDRFQTMSDQIISRIDDMGSRIDDLEHNINDLMAQSGQADQGALQDQSSKQ